MKSRVFVYGTLLRGQQRNDLLENEIFLGEVRTAPQFTLISLGPFPAIVRYKENQVLGELYEVSDATLWLLDQVEGVPHLYRREEIELEDGSTAIAYLLPHMEEGMWEIKSGSWLEYNNRKEQ